MTRPSRQRAITRSVLRSSLVAVLLAALLTGCGSSEPDVTVPAPPADQTEQDAAPPQPTPGDPELRARWAALIDDVDEDDITPTVVALHALLDRRLPIVDLDPATGPWTVVRTEQEPTLRCHGDAALFGIVSLRQHDAAGQPTHGPDVFLSLQTDVAAMAPTEGWQLTTEPQFGPGHPAYDDGVRGTVHRLEGHGEVWFVTVSYEPDIVTGISYCPADLDPRLEPDDAQAAIEQTRAAIARGDHAEAARLVLRALATDPANRELRMLAYARHGDEMLHTAFWDGDEEAVATLATIVPDIDHPDERFGASTLVLAAAWGQTGMVQVLLEAGADANAGADRDGNTALMWAAKNFDEQLEMAHQLLAAGADVHARNIRNETALSIAEQYQNPNIVALLREHGAIG